MMCAFVRFLVYGFDSMGTCLSFFFFPLRVCNARVYVCVQVAGSPWAYRASSVFAPRGTQHARQLERLSWSDVKSMHDVVDDVSKRRAFNVDWRACLAKEERFLNLCKKVAHIVFRAMAIANGFSSFSFRVYVSLYFMFIVLANGW